MKKLFPLLILILTFSSFGQKKQVSIEEFDRIELNSYKYLRENSYRSMSVIERFDSKTLALKSVWKTLYERTTSGYQYSSETFESDGKKSKTESLAIEKQYFVRRNEGKWKKESWGSTGGSQPNSEIKFLGRTQIGDEIELVYEVTKKPTSFYNKAKTTFWFNEKGMLLRTVFRSESAKTSEIIISRKEFDYKTPIVEMKIPKIE